MTRSPTPTKPWPSWAGRWYGIVLRLLVAIWGVLLGLYLILAGYYTAVDWKTGESNWTAEAVFFIVAGIILTGYSLWGAIKPSKLSLLPPALFFFSSGILLLLAAVSGGA